MLKLERRARGHFVMLIEILVHLIRVHPELMLRCTQKLLKALTFYIDHNFHKDKLHPQHGEIITNVLCARRINVCLILMWWKTLSCRGTYKFLLTLLLIFNRNNSGGYVLSMTGTTTALNKVHDLSAQMMFSDRATWNENSPAGGLWWNVEKTFAHRGTLNLDLKP